MISYEEIENNAKLIFNDYIKYTIAQIINSNTIAKADETAEVSYFPLILHLNSNMFTDSIKEKAAIISEIYENSKNETGTGYTLDIETIRTRSSGRKRVIKRIYFLTEEDYLDFIDKNEQVEALKQGLQVIIEENILKREDLESWSIAHTDVLMTVTSDNFEYNSKFWHNICKCAKWLKENPDSNLYIKEIPIDVPSKFLEENKSIIHSLVSSSPIHISFEADHGLKNKPLLIRFRSLSIVNPITLGKATPEEIGLPIQDFAHLTQTPFLKGINTILFIENEMPYLTFPKVEGALAIYANSSVLNALKVCEWLKQFKLVYFGNLEEHSYNNLSSFRSYFPNVFSLCMDSQTLEFFSKFMVKGDILKNNAIPKHLTEDERLAFLALRLNEKKNKLEQDKIELEYIKTALNALVCNF